MFHQPIKLTLLLPLALLATGCRIALTVTSGGDVLSLSGTNDCAGGSLCEYEVIDTSFIETFTAAPREGYVFSKWQGGAGYLCPESINPTCTIENGLVAQLPAAQREIADTIIASGTYLYAQPLFTFVGIDTDEDGVKDYIDDDDDNDGVLDPDDNCPLKGPNLDGFGCQTKTVFVTSETYTGDLDGLVGADQKCNSLAATASLPGTYKAWLSSYGLSASARFVQSQAPYVLTDGTRVADDWSDLTDGLLAAPIDVTEEGISLTQTSEVWTGTSEVGNEFAFQGALCNDGAGDTWESTSAFLNGPIGVAEGAITGRTNLTTSGWSAQEFMGCDGFRRLYCFQQ